jgi:hypothetical protein
MKKLKRKIASIAMATVMLVSIGATLPTSTLAMSSAFVGQSYLNAWVADAEGDGDPNTYILQVDQYYGGDGTMLITASGANVSYSTGLLSTNEPIYYDSTGAVNHDWVLKTTYTVSGTTVTEISTADWRYLYSTTPPSTSSTTTSSDTSGGTSTTTTDTPSTYTDTSSDASGSGTTDTDTEEVEEEVVIEVSKDDFTVSLDNFNLEDGTYKITIPEGVESVKVWVDSVGKVGRQYNYEKDLSETGNITLPTENGAYNFMVVVTLSDGTEETYQLGGFVLDTDNNEAQLLTSDEVLEIQSCIQGVLGE